MAGHNILMAREGRLSQAAAGDLIRRAFSRVKIARLSAEAVALAAAVSEPIGVGTYAPSPQDTRPFGIDVSRFNLVDWPTVVGWAAPRVQYVMIRTGQAMKGAYDEIDRRVFYNVHNARAAFAAAGLPPYIELADGTRIDRVMLYHVVYPGSPVAPQAENALRIIRLLGRDVMRYGPAWVDMELAQGQTGAKIIDATGELIWRLQVALTIPVGDYTGPWFIRKYRVPQRDWWKEIWWWFAQYGSKGEATLPLEMIDAIPSGRILFHQTTSALEGMLFGAGAGSRVDGNRLLLPMAA